MSIPNKAIYAFAISATLLCTAVGCTKDAPADNSIPAVSSDSSDAASESAQREHQEAMSKF